ncbi:hypothetical protein [Thermosulfidibacter takaii]|uniref:hypothetical protein n=1 Tax=Thermosulfidibacter takaii TaxID=412593 RepID=UPI000837C565|nr:hypothetical protein [Thermosulfidibacter takaii]
MNISPNKFYWLILKVGDWEKPGRCMHLSVRPLKEEEKEQIPSMEVEPTHVINFFDFEARRQIFGKLVEETDKRIVFQIAPSKYYIFQEFEG